MWLYPLVTLLCTVISRAMKHLCFTLCSGISMSLWVFCFIAEAGLELGNSRLWKDWEEWNKHCLLNIPGPLYLWMYSQVAYTQHTWKQAGCHSNVTWRGTHRAPPLAEEWKLLAVGGGMISSQGMWSLVGCSYNYGWPYVHAHMGSTNWTLWGLWEEDMKILGGGWRWHRRIL